MTAKKLTIVVFLTALAMAAVTITVVLGQSPDKMDDVGNYPDPGRQNPAHGQISPEATGDVLNSFPNPSALRRLTFQEARLSPSGLVEVGRLEGGPAYQAIHASGDLVYGLVYSGGWLEIVDVSDPANPFVRSTLDLPFSDGHDLWYGEWETHKYVFTGHRHGDVTMVDVSDPYSPTVVSTTNTGYIHKGLQSVGHYLYYSEHTGGPGGGLRIYDFASGTLSETGHWLQDLPCQINGIEMAVRSDGAGVYQYDEFKSAWDDQVCGGPNEKALFYDTTDKSAPVTSTTFLPPPRGSAPVDWTDMVLSPDDQYLYLAHGESGVLIYDLSNSSAPSLTATLGEALYEVTLDPEEEVLYAGGGSSSGDTLLVIDVRDPTAPTVMHTVTPLSARDLWFDGDYLYVTNEEAKLLIYRLSPPVVSSVSPTGTVPGTVGLVATINGDYFRDNEPPTVSFGIDVTVTSAEFISRTQIQATLDVDSGAALGLRDVTVTNFDGQSGVGAGLFEIVGTSPLDPPTVSAVLPEQVAAVNQTVRLIVTGDNFVKLPAVSTTPGEPEITVGTVTYLDDTRLQVDVHVWPTTTLGTVDLTVTNPDGQAGTLEDAFEIVAPLFTDVAYSLGLYSCSYMNGVAWGDLDGDGWLDLTIGADYLFTNTAGSFSNATGDAGLDYVGQYGGAAWGDYDNDGDLDLLSSWRKVYRQEDGLPFTKVWDGDGRAAPLAWVDYDLDDDLDVFASGRLYRNDGGDTFTDITVSAGLNDTDSLMASVWADYDDDGAPDLYLTCDNCENRLYHNSGDGTFSDVTSTAGVGDAGSGRGATWGDYDNDGDFDLFVSNANGQYSLLYRNNGDGTFNDVSAAAGLHDWPGFATGANWLDYSLDGWLDLFVANQGGRHRLYRNNGDGTFTDVGPGAGVAGQGGNDGSAVGDYDNDGDPDIFIVGWCEGAPDVLLQNSTDPGAGGPHWLKVRLEGTLSNHSAIGAVVRIYGAGPMQTRQFAGSSGYMSQDALEALFGLGTYTGTVTVEVTWPSDVVDTLTDVAVDQSVTVTESTPYLHDITVVSVAPDGEIKVNTTFNVRASLRNLGQQVESSVPVTCEIEHASASVYTAVRTSEAIQPAHWAMLDFPAYTPTDLGAYILTCQSALLDDERPANDVVSRTLTVVPQIPDAWTKDNPDDNGDVPSGGSFYHSPDIWVRNEADGGLVHQNAILGTTNTVYVRLRNRGEGSATGTVDVYWIGPSLGVRCGDWAYIGTITFTSLSPGEVRIVSVPWVPTRTGHTCLHTVIDADGDPYDRGLECALRWTRYDNNVSWRNLEIYDNSGTRLTGTRDVQQAEVQLVNVYDLPQDVDVIIDRMTFPTTGTITVLLPDDLFDRWLAYGAGWGDGIEVLTATREIRVTGAVSATIGAVPMAASEGAPVGLRFEGPAGLEFEMAIREAIDGITTGGVGYQWVIPDTTPPGVVGTSPADGATDVALDAPIVITFTEQIGPLSLNLTLTPTLSVTTTWNEAGTVVMAAHASFAKGTTYTATVLANDAAGNALAEQASWTFTALRYKIYLPIILRQ